MFGLLLASAALETALWSIGSVAVTAAVSGGVGLLVKYKVNKKIEQREQEKSAKETLEKQKEEQASEEKVRSILKEEIEPIKDTLTKVADILEKNSNGTLSCLRNDILTCYYKCNEKGYRNDYDYTNIHDLFDAYQDLGGNSFIHDIMDNRFDALPTKEEFEKKQKKATSKTKRISKEN